MARQLAKLVVVGLIVLSACASPPAAAPPKEKGVVAKQEAVQQEPLKQPTAASAPLKKIKIVYGAISAAYTPFWIALETDIFTRNGLEVEAIYVEGGSKVAQAMVAGQFPVAFLGGDPVIRATMGGGDLVMIASSVGTMVAQLLTTKDIKSIQDLKGKSIGVTRFSTVTDFAGRYALKKYGLEPEKDVAILQIGGLPEILAAMQSGGIQAGVLTPPHNVFGRRMGFVELLDLSTLGLEYQQSGLAATRSFIKTDEDTVKRIIKSYVEGIQRYHADPKFSMEVIKRYTKMDDQEVLEDTYRTYTNQFPKAPYPLVKGMQFILDDVSKEDPRAKTANPETFVDLRFVKELEDNGFIKKLYEK